MMTAAFGNSICAAKLDRAVHVQLHQAAAEGTLRLESLGGKGRKSPPEPPVLRARREARRYAVANDLCQLVTVTYRNEPSSRSRVQKDVTRFIKALRESFGDRFPYLYVLERGGKERLHAHLLMPRWVSSPIILRHWHHGRVDVRRLRTREHIRSAVRYVLKDDSRSVRKGGEHRYEAAQGFQPQVVRALFRSLRDALQWVWSQMRDIRPIRTLQHLSVMTMFWGDDP